jgi:hypothetical protein
MDETPEQVLARLQRYVDSTKVRGGFPSATYDLPHPSHSFRTVSRTIAGQVLCVATCVVTILLWINVAHTVTYVFVAAATATCAAGLVRHVPFAGWVLLGLVLGLGIGGLS